MTGLVVYGVLATAYDRFYSELGLTPADVGLQYGKTLGGAAALALLFILIAPFLALGIRYLLNQMRALPRRRLNVALIILVVVAAVAWLIASLNLGFLTGGVLLAVVIAFYAGVKSKDWKEDGAAVAAAAVAAGITWLFLSTGVGLYANYYANSVKRGDWIKPPESGSLVFFSVRAMPTNFVPATRSPTDLAFARAHENHRLLFLGVSNGLLIIYDATAQESLMVPAADFRVGIVNCETYRSRSNLRCR
ncbi:hypothetical protein SAMN05421678_101119 [Actinopolymorpha cephalotaxi]|uniref:Uncharacterized protein n=1 Tax=Actinopolymorpha cephalotaxi TaxID=504797 RepID=A0A1I2K817_9ACTN|nr:hypothetical protein SAMN05421678_101119 [Actinopolymorpha cephalotaxi]